MAIAKTLTRAQAGMAAPEVVVETHLAGGIPRFQLVGLPEAAVRESVERVRAAISSAGLEVPSRRITVNLAPADLPKEGGRYDLPIALGVLAASGQLGEASLDGTEFYGELSLDGALRGVRGVLPAVMAARGSGRTVVVAAEDAPAVARVPQVDLRVARHLIEVVAHLAGREPLPSPEPQAPAADARGPDLDAVRGQHQARRALEVAAAGGHSLLFSGPPGTGKTLLASRLPGVLPPPDEHECLEIAAVRSLAGATPVPWGRRPFRAPHHTASGVALVGGGSTPRPGEVSLAHRGVLFLDELPEFSRRVLEVLREPMESGRIHISRAARQVEFPARFQLVAAMNPCPCGYAGDASGRCHCSREAIARYAARVSGPLLDRIDLQVAVLRLPAGELLDPASVAESSSTVRDRVAVARARAIDRQGMCNAELAPEGLQHSVLLDSAARSLLQQALGRLDLSARACHRVLRVARTIADLAGEERVESMHLAEALALRRMDMSAGPVC